uniref:Uncharacterized protein n=1 Tax=Oryza nivara TaxID=4536 RepID=A0A0E0G5B6_ORYNI
MAVATRTGKPSLDMFLAEMRRFEVLPSAVKNCWNVTSLLLLARSLLLAPVYCRRAAASSPEPLSSPSAAGAEVNVGFPLPSDLNVDLADWRMASRRSFRDYLRKVFEIVSASCMVVQLFGDIKEEITIWREAGFM